MDTVTILLSVLGAIFVPIGAFVAYMARRQRLEEEAAEDARDARGTAAE
jgi:hypothetical protein